MRLLGFGQIMASTVDVPGAILSTDTGGAEAELRISAGADTTASNSHGIYAIEGGSLLFRPPGVAQYRCSRKGIEIAKDPGAASDAVTALLIATALPAVLWMQGRFVLHASAVQLPYADEALAIAGPSGSGKSTLAGQLVASGGRLLADDCLSLETNADHVQASGLPGGLYTVVPGAPTRAFLPTPEGRSLVRGKLGAILVLETSGTGWSIEQLGPIPSLERLLANQHRPAIPALLGKQQEVLHHCSRILRWVRLYTWHRPHDRRALDPAELTALAGLVQRREKDDGRDRVAAR